MARKHPRVPYMKCHRLNGALAADLIILRSTLLVSGTKCNAQSLRDRMIDLLQPER